MHFHTALIWLVEREFLPAPFGISGPYATWEAARAEQSMLARLNEEDGRVVEVEDDDVVVYDPTGDVPLARLEILECDDPCELELPERDEAAAGDEPGSVR